MGCCWFYKNKKPYFWLLPANTTLLPFLAHKLPLTVVSISYLAPPTVSAMFLVPFFCQTAYYLSNNLAPPTLLDACSLFKVVGKEVLLKWYGPKFWSKEILNKILTKQTLQLQKCHMKNFECACNKSLTKGVFLSRTANVAWQIIHFSVFILVFDLKEIVTSLNKSIYLFKILD